jgi:hypothetical protein
MTPTNIQKKAVLQVKKEEFSYCTASIMPNL